MAAQEDTRHWRQMTYAGEKVRVECFWWANRLIGWYHGWHVWGEMDANGYEHLYAAPERF